MRTSVSLNGTWNLAQGFEKDIPNQFPHSVAVPGYVDLASPAIESVGEKSELRSHFWYRTTFTTPENLLKFAYLQFRKARYGMKAWLNGSLLGEHLFNFSQTTLDCSEAMHPPGESNELVVRVGADPSVLPDHIVWGHDFEKILYHPGLYDEVNLILCTTPRIENVQIVPNIDDSSVSFHVWIEPKDSSAETTQIRYTISEDQGGKVVSEGTTTIKGQKDSFSVSLQDAQLWSPESPFLYRITISTAGDSFTHRFGMRKFLFNPESGYAELNNQTYFLRGTNICMDRFSEDVNRGNKPWDREWARKLLGRIKEMNWNSFRFCLGFPPEFWYDLCDEMGILVQDEYPIWYGAKAEDFPKSFKGELIAKEYASWMSERWNHTCVVIWDAQNESVTDETGKAISLVRDLDFNDRPWDNGYSPPDRPSDPVETHPYVLQNFLGREPGSQGPLHEFLTEKRIPDNGPSELYPPSGGGKYPNPIQNNENVFFWITRGGRPTQLTKWIFQRLYGKELREPDFYYKIYSYFFNRIISYWRCYRTSATVQEFAILSHSREAEEGGSFTSDHWADLEELVYHPYYQQYCYNAFYPVGILIDRWEDWFRSSQIIEIPIKLINDRYETWNGEISLVLRLIEGDESLHEQSAELSLAPLGAQDSRFPFTTPEKEGNYILTASLQDMGKTVTNEYCFRVDNRAQESTYDTGKENKQYIHSEDRELMK